MKAGQVDQTLGEKAFFVGFSYFCRKFVLLNFSISLGLQLLTE